MRKHARKPMIKIIFASNFDEAKHPRDEKGRFATSEGARTIPTLLAKLSRAKTVKNSEKTTAQLSNAFSVNAKELKDMLPAAKGSFKTWVYKSMKANEDAVQKLNSGKLSELQENRVKAIMINFNNIMKANKQYKAQQKPAEKPSEKPKPAEKKPSDMTKEEIKDYVSKTANKIIKKLQDKTKSDFETEMKARRDHLEKIKRGETTQTYDEMKAGQNKK